MLILDSPFTDPHFNLAAEEYLMLERREDIAFFYANEASVVIGKHQNAYAEINLEYILEQKIPVVRRLSGGGTVWHDPGNLNFTFLLNGEEGRLVNFRAYAEPVLAYLQQMGLPAAFGERNEMMVGGLKVSGNAEHVKKKRVLHHGTLLFNADLERLRRALDADPDRYTDKAVQSVRSAVGNIASFLHPPGSMERFRQGLLAYLLKSKAATGQAKLSKAEIEKIRDLSDRKYRTWDWNFGYSPRYRLKRSATLSGERIAVELHVEKGVIRELSLEGPLSDSAEITARIWNALAGERHDPATLQQRLNELDIASEAEIDTLVKALF